MSLLPLLIDSTLKATTLLCCAGIVGFLLRRSSSAIRHMIWSLAVVGALALPVLGAVVPAWRTPLLPEIWPEGHVEAGQPNRGTADPEIGKALDRRGSELDATGESLDRLGDHIDRGDEAGAEALAGSLDRVTPAMPTLSVKDSRGAVGNSGSSAVGTDPQPARSTPSIGVALVLIWSAGAALIVLLLIGERLRVWRLASRAQPVHDPRILRRRDVLCRRLELPRPPRLLQADGAAMPMTWGFWRPVLLLPSGVGAWNDARLDAVLLHELAHVRRYDYAIQLAAGLTCALYWFNPLAWVAARRLRVEREHACDDEVLRAGSAASSYASELLEMARSLRCHRTTELAAMTMARPSQLTGRLLAVLDESRSRRPVSRCHTAAGAALLLTLLLPLAGVRPAAAEATPSKEGSDRPVSETSVAIGVPQAPGCWDPRAPHRSRVHRSDSEGRMDLLWYNDECRVEIQVRGVVEFADDFTRIAGISEDGFLRILERSDGVARELEVRPGDDGPSFLWWVDAEQREFDPAGRAWLAARLIPLIRRAGLAVDQRVAWILEREGVDGVLEEVRIISGDGLEAEYLLELIDQARLEGGELEEALSLAADELGSDSGMASFLLGVAERTGAAAVSVRPFWDAASTVSSDSEHSRLLLALVDIVPVTDEVIEAVLSSAQGNIGSDSEMAEFLTRLAARPNVAVGPSADAFWKAAGTVGSDSEHRRMLVDLVMGAEADSPTPRLALRSASRNIGSDSEMAEFLASFGDRYPDLITGGLRTEFLAAAATVGSDSEHADMLLHLTRGEASPPLLDLALASATANIGSDSSMRHVLVLLAERYPSLVRGELRQAYLSAVATVGSDSEQRRVMSALELEDGRR